jgi:hypothetical protein
VATKKQPSLTHIFAQTNAAMADAAQHLDPTTGWRDQVFELLMARLDVACEHYDTLQPWWQSLNQNGAQKAQGWAQANYAMRLAKQHVPTAPHVWVLVWVYQQALAAFYATHPSPDAALDKAMIALDQALDKYDSLQSGAWFKQAKTFIQQKATRHAT